MSREEKVKCELFVLEDLVRRAQFYLNPDSVYTQEQLRWFHEEIKAVLDLYEEGDDG